MRWLILKTTAAMFAALLGVVLIVYQQNYLKSSFRAAEKTGDSFRALHTDYITLQRIVLQASYFPYFDNDKILTQIREIEQRLNELSNDPRLRGPAYRKTFRDLLGAKERFEKVTETIYEFLTINASLKNSTVYLPTLALKAYDIFDTHSTNDRRVVMLLSKINATLFLAKNALDESFLEEVKTYKSELESLKQEISDRDKKRLLQATVGHLDLFLKIFPKFRVDLEKILDTEFQNYLERAIRDFSEESGVDMAHVNTLAELFLALYLISILIVIYFIFRFERENIELKKVQEQLRKSLITDHLTGLENREAYVGHKKEMKHPALILVNIDRFKHINEFYGSKTGDMVLQRSAQILREIVPLYLQAHIYRLGGDDFGILYEFKSRERTERVIKDILKHFHEKTLDIDGVFVDISISIGASYDAKLLETADMALKITKSSKRRRYTIYEPSLDMSETISRNILALKRLKRAISRNDIIPYFQPIIEIGSGAAVKYEALARMRTEDGAILEPAQFLEAAKEAKLSGEITAAILRRTLKMAEESDTVLSVNISAGDIMNIHDRSMILDLLESHEGCAWKIVFEIVESEEIEDYEILGEFIKEIRALGSKIAIDDFGSGYSNFEKLLQLKIDILKIDGSLIKDIDRNENAELVVRTIVDFAKGAGLKTVAEYVHSEAILEKVKALGIDFAQGFYLGKPQPVPQPKQQEQADIRSVDGS
ncbi:diguanylate cyclase/phosphodiesterase (GGDEF & EAL domains) with PAS/PAC sensor [Hydrogenimonas sp.]|nr:diguanylate cyclase/phosphodiesterase (GGDEF & EAL domains) with PAS/PAC sensor [Hydrogenimonas sp.]